jgi:(p)ppGpp synthase/HD superfamily hydrolase
MKRWSQDIFIRAFSFAARAHGAQKLAGTEYPYLYHISLVRMEIIAALNSEGERDGNLAIQCALLHDVLEDTDTSPEQLRSEFGSELTNGVKALTKNRSLSGPARIQDSLNRIVRQPREVGMVKMADRITNLQSPPAHWEEDKIREYREEALLIHNRLREGSPLLAERLKLMIDNYERFIHD